MNLRFLKKRDGGKILQCNNVGRGDWEDVPLVEETTTLSGEGAMLLQKVVNTLQACEMYSSNSDKYLVLLNRKSWELLIGPVDLPREGGYNIRGSSCYLVEELKPEYKVIGNWSQYAKQ